MNCFVVRQKPNSYNYNKGPKKAAYLATLQKAFEKLNGLPTKHTSKTPLYGIAYYFYKIDLLIDSDNISKPIWDSLRSYLYDDDNILQLTTVGKWNLVANAYSILDLSGIPSHVAVELIDALDSEDHIIYIECGHFSSAMFRFNLERYGD